MNRFDELEKLANLHKKKIITTAEFEEQKQQLLAIPEKSSSWMPRTKRNLPETIFMWAMWGIVLVFIAVAMGGSLETVMIFKTVFFVVIGFLLLPVSVLWIVALCLQPFVIRARYFAYFLLLPIVLALTGYLIDYATSPFETVEYSVYFE